MECTQPVKKRGGGGTLARERKSTVAPSEKRNYPRPRVTERREFILLNTISKGEAYEKGEVGKGERKIRRQNSIKKVNDW